MVDAGLLPVKPLAEAKRRLAPSFDAPARLRIARALLQDALDLCRATAALRWSVVTADEEVAALAVRAGLGVFPDPRRSLNLALSEALRALSARGAWSATVMVADLPLARAEDVQDILDTGETSDLVVVPSASDAGTSALHLRPPELLVPRFGAGSLRAHVMEAERMSLRCSILSLPRLALDIDTAADLETLREAGPQTHTGKVLEALAAERPQG